MTRKSSIQLEDGQTPTLKRFCICKINKKFLLMDYNYIHI